MHQLVAQIRTQQWITMIREQRASGLSVKSWCVEKHISENCFYYRQRRIREIVGNEIPEFVEIHQPDHSAAETPKNITITAVIQSGRIQISLSNSASEELISRIMRNLNA